MHPNEFWFKWKGQKEPRASLSPCVLPCPTRLHLQNTSSEKTKTSRADLGHSRAQGSPERGSVGLHTPVRCRWPCCQPHPSQGQTQTHSTAVLSLAGWPKAKLAQVLTLRGLGSGRDMLAKGSTTETGKRSASKCSSALAAEWLEDVTGTFQPF